MKYLFKYNNFFYNYNFFKLKIIIFYMQNEIKNIIQIIILIYKIQLNLRVRLYKTIMKSLTFNEN